MDGIFIAGIVLCLAGQPIEYDNCVFERSVHVFRNKELCEAALYLKTETLHLTYDLEKLKIVNINCYNWLPEEKKPNL